MSKYNRGFARKRIQAVENSNLALEIERSHVIFGIAHKLAQNAMANPERMAELEEAGLVTVNTRYPLKHLRDVNGEYVRHPTTNKHILIEDQSKPIVTKYVSPYVYWDEAKKIAEEESLYVFPCMLY